MEKIKITNFNQFEKLVEELEKNPSLAKGFRRGTVPSNFKEQWENIATSLNALGPPIRTGDGWQKIWRDLKFKTKKKLIANKTECKATGGGMYKQLVLSPLEESVANLLQFEKQLNPEGMVQGIPNTEFELPHTEISVDFNLMEVYPANSSSCVTIQPSTSTAAPSTSTAAPSASTATPSASTATPSASTATPSASTNALKRKRPSPIKKKPTERNELLQKHSDTQARLLTDISSSMSSIKHCLRDLREIESKRLKLEEERSKREEEMYKTDLQIKRLKLAIKHKELELINNKCLE